MPKKRREEKWLSLEAAAAAMKRDLNRIKTQIRNGRLTLERHYRRTVGDHIEINIDEYRKWLQTNAERRKLPLVERLRLEELDEPSDAGRAAGLSRSVQSPPPPAEHQHSVSGKKRPKLIPVQVWADEMFGEYRPGRNTVLSWVKYGKIVPLPIKIGRTYFCSPEARYYDPVSGR